MRRTQLVLVSLLVPALSLADSHGHPRPGPTAEQAIQKLKEGNARFAAGKSAHPDQAVARRLEITKGQKPFATVLGCSDSRVPPELIFDQGLGDLFVVRVAGNVADRVDLGSIEYSVEHLGVPVVVVLGHHSCGAVQATADAMANGGKAEGNVGAIVEQVAPSVEQAKRSPGKEKAGLVHDAVHANVTRTAASLLERSPVLKQAVAEGKVKIVKAVYDLDSGTLEWM